MKDFKDRVAVITGAASGIGYGLAERCAQEGMKVVLADVEEGALAQAEKNINALGATTLTVKTDVSRADDVKALAEKTLDAFGAVHLLFNNAGVGTFLHIWEYTMADWKWTLGVNLWGVIHGIHFFVPIMLKQNSECHIVNTASVGGLTTGLMNGPYATSKHGVVALSETLYREMEQGGHNVGVSVLCPGIISTRIYDCERNRPGELRNDPADGKINLTSPNGQAVTELMTKMVKNGMPPQQVANIVFSAIREKKFYILPNAEPYKPMIQSRLENIIQERNPTMPVSGS